MSKLRFESIKSIEITCQNLKFEMFYFKNHISNVVLFFKKKLLGILLDIRWRIKEISH